MSRPGFGGRNKLLRYDIIEKKYYFNFHMICCLCFYALYVQSYADWKKLWVITDAKSLNREIKSEKVEILHNLQNFERKNIFYTNLSLNLFNFQKSGDKRLVLTCYIINVLKIKKMLTLHSCH